MMRVRSIRNRRGRAMTLLEVMLSMSLLVVLSTMTYSFYYASLSSKARGTERASKVRLMRTVLRRISEEIRQSVVKTTDFGLGFSGGSEAIELTTLRVPRRDLAREQLSKELPVELEYDLVKIQYKIARHPDIVNEAGFDQPLGLARVEQRIPRRLASKRVVGGEKDALENSAATAKFFRESLRGSKDATGKAAIGPEINWEEMYAPDIHYIRFCYYDGYSWWDTWHVVGDDPLPQLVQVTVGFGDHPPLDGNVNEDEVNQQFCSCLNKEPSDCLKLGKDEYSTVVRVSRADPLFRSRVSRESQLLSQKLQQDDVAAEEDTQ